MFGPNSSCSLQMSGCLYSPHSTGFGSRGVFHVMQAGFGPEVWKEVSDSEKACYWFTPQGVIYRPIVIDGCRCYSALDQILRFFPVISIPVSLPLSHSCGRLQWASRVWFTSIITARKAQGHTATSMKLSLAQQGRCCRAFESSHKLLPSFTSPPRAFVLCCEG